MRTLLVCLLLLFSLLAVVVLRWLTGSGALDADAAGMLAMHSLYAIADGHGVPLPRSMWSEYLLASFLIPGAYLETQAGILPTGPKRLAFALVASWWIWVASARVAWCVVGRAFGVVSTGSYHYWLWLVPPWRPPYRVWLRIERWWKQFRYGKQATAAWASMLAAMAIPYKPGDSVFVGRVMVAGWKLFATVAIAGSRHIAVIAATGAGKTRWLKAFLGMLSRWASALIIDCDANMVNALAPSLIQRGHKVINLDPYRLSNILPGCWNALDEITAAVRRHGREAAVRFALTLAEAVIQDDNKHQPVFAAGARNFLHGLILYVWLFEPAGKRNLVRVRELLARGMPELVIDPRQDPFNVLLKKMESVTNIDDGCQGQIVDVIARGAAVMRSGKGRDGNPFRTTALSQTMWLDIPEVASISQHSDFGAEDLKNGNPFVFLVAPVTDIQNKLSGWVRALVMMTAYTFQNMPGKRRVPCAFCIDEMPSLGRIETFEVAAPVFRKYGIRLVAIAQDLERLKQAYPDSWGSFLGNAQATIWMGNDHQETLEYLSKALGATTRTQKVDGGLLSKLPARLEKQERPLMTPDQLREFLDPERGQIIVTRTGKAPLKVAYEGFDKALPVWRYEQDHNYREPILRALTRRLLSGWRAATAPTNPKKLPRPKRKKSVAAE